ncbi:MAG: hypothetical protein NC932_03795, partial [Candidatus Omnitrophica bacterium]|nr:hypothetical protein [Candidatus Omnitrophota bacterium]
SSQVHPPKKPASNHLMEEDYQKKMKEYEEYEKKMYEQQQKMYEEYQKQMQQNQVPQNYSPPID